MSDQGDADKVAAEKYHEAQARRLMVCYEEANGRPAPSAEALQEWLATKPDIPLDEHGGALPLWEGHD